MIVLCIVVGESWQNKIDCLVCFEMEVFRFFKMKCYGFFGNFFVVFEFGFVSVYGYIFEISNVEDCFS